MRIPIHDVSFDAEAIQAMGAAFDRACDSLRHCGLTAAAREIIAKRIIQVAKTGERDPVRLCEQSLNGYAWWSRSNDNIEWLIPA